MNHSPPHYEEEAPSDHTMIMAGRSLGRMPMQDGKSGDRLLPEGFTVEILQVRETEGLGNNQYGQLG
jgi:hypothetical protein